MNLKDIEALGKRLMQSGRGEDIKRLADTEDGMAISRMVDAEALGRAASRGDLEALKGIVSQVLSSSEGKRLAESIEEMMK